jgi:ABC-type lipoprotein export system ATPase subunit
MNLIIDSNLRKEPIIRLVNLVRRYKVGQSVVEAVAGVSLEIAAGEFVALVGASGSGKSTLLNLLGGLDTPTEGEVWVEDVNLAKAKRNILDRHRQHTVGFIFQSFNLLPTRTALENVAMPMVLVGERPAPRHARALELLAQMGLANRGDHLPNALSGGEQQRIAIARALANNPRLILADEPTGNLDSKNGAEVMRLLRELNRERGVTLIIVTHDPAVAAYADRVVRLLDGKIVEISVNPPASANGQYPAPGAKEAVEVRA